MKRDLELVRQIMRDVEELQNQFRSSTAAVQNSTGAVHPPPERRRDHRTATTVANALRMKTAFGAEAARRFLQRCSVQADVADRILASRHDQRQQPDRRRTPRA